MIISMTGFASYSISLLEQQEEQCVLDIEIKTFNSRFFEPSCKLPGNLSAYEMEVVQRLKKALVRGRVYCTVRVNGYSALLEKLVFSHTRVKEYLATTKILQDKFGMQGGLTVDQVMGLPNIFSTERTQLPQVAIERFLGGIDKALEQVVSARVEEGCYLEADLLKRFAYAQELIENIKSASKVLIEDQKRHITMQQGRAQEGDEEARAVLSERYGALDKMDVHEEIVRFCSHLESVKEHMAGNRVEKGRKLDFILQELMREINTIMAKCSSYQISAYAVDIKVELEKAREQVQNIV